MLMKFFSLIFAVKHDVFKQSVYFEVSYYIIYHRAKILRRIGRECMLGALMNLN